MLTKPEETIAKIQTFSGIAASKYCEKVGPGGPASVFAILFPFENGVITVGCL